MSLTESDSTKAPGWYPDDKGRMRWWDGTSWWWEGGSWTERLQPGGARGLRGEPATAFASRPWYKKRWGTAVHEQPLE
jgi:hypothetical protein